MHPKTRVTFDPESFNRVKRTIALMSQASRERGKEPTYAAPRPEEIGIQLTHRCNLRCHHCFQWNHDGLFRKFSNEKQRQDLSVDIVERLLKETHEARSRLYIWGGEPLFHRQWRVIAGLLEADPRWTVLCTNGLLIEQEMESILSLSPNLAILASVDGFQEDHDAIRGKGTFHRTIRNIRLLLELQKKGRYKGTVSLSCVLSDSMARKLFDFMSYCEDLGIDTLYFGFPWYIPESTAERMDRCYQEQFSWLNHLPFDRKPSWWSYTHHLDLSVLDDLRTQLDMLKSRTWGIRIRFQPNVRSEELEGFVAGQETPVQARTRCLAVSNRMDVLADGTVTACKFFPEFAMGDLHTHGVVETWRNDRFTKFRESISAGLMPVCSKCVLLYLNGR